LSGMLSPMSQPQEEGTEYEFLHYAMLDYLAACYVERRMIDHPEQLIEFLKKHLAVINWSKRDFLAILLEKCADNQVARAAIVTWLVGCAYSSEGSYQLHVCVSLLSKPDDFNLLIEHMPIDPNDPNSIDPTDANSSDDPTDANSSDPTDPNQSDDPTDPTDPRNYVKQKTRLLQACIGCNILAVTKLMDIVETTNSFRQVAIAACEADCVEVLELVAPRLLTDGDALLDLLELSFRVWLQACHFLLHQ
jgi:hypothetical protein